MKKSHSSHRDSLTLHHKPDTLRRFIVPLFHARESALTQGMSAITLSESIESISHMRHFGCASSLSKQIKNGHWDEKEMQPPDSLYSFLLEADSKVNYDNLSHQSIGSDISSIEPPPFVNHKSSKHLLGAELVVPTDLMPHRIRGDSNRPSPSAESSLVFGTSPLTASSYHTMQLEYDRDTWRMFNRIQCARNNYQQASYQLLDTPEKDRESADDVTHTVPQDDYRQKLLHGENDEELCSSSEDDMVEEIFDLELE